MSASPLQQTAGFYSGNVLLVDDPLCLNLRGRREWCDACAERCPAGALTLGADAIDLDATACTGCGACLPACPAGALRMSGFSPRRLLEALSGQERVHLHCVESRDGGGGVVVPCHRVLDARLLAAAAGEGVKEIRLHGLDRCGGCARGDGVRHTARERATLKRWLGPEAPIVAPAGAGERGDGERRRADQARVNRRDFLRLAGVHAAAGMVPQALDEGEPESPFYQADLRSQRAAAYQAVLAERVAQIPWAAPPPWTQRTLGEACSACLACGERCPTGALRAEEGAGARSITFEAALCTDCRLCERLCPEQAVEAGPVADAAEVTAPRRRLLFRQVRPCRRCGQPFQPGEADDALCPVCRNEEELDGEWLAMLGE